MQQPTKVDLAAEIEELTRGAVVNEFLDRWTGKVKRVELGIKLAQNKWGQPIYRHDELVQIRDWIKSHLWRERGERDKYLAVEPIATARKGDRDGVRDSRAAEN